MKSNVPDFSWVFKKENQHLLSLLEGRFVGGAVRNTLLGRPPHDFDVATPYTPSVVIERLKKEGIRVIPTGLAHGTVTAIYNETPYEITTLRRDVVTDGRHAEVAFTDSFEEDARRRDFTINALSVDSQGILYDYFGGEDDLARGIIRFIGDPNTRIHEDYLRILRLFRFAAYYGQYIDPASLSAACALQSHLVSLSGERITKEILRLLEAPSPFPTVDLLHKKGFFPYILDTNTPPPLFAQLWLLEQELDLCACPLTRLYSLSQGAVSRLVLSRVQKNFLHHVGIPLPLPFSFEEVIKSLYAHGEELTQGRLLITSAARNMPLQEVREALDLLETELPVFPLTGKEALALGLSGQAISAALTTVREWWITEHMQPGYHACVAYLKRLNNTL